MNMKGRAVEIRTSKYTSDDGAIQKGEDFVVRTSLDCCAPSCPYGIAADSELHRGRSVSDSM